MHWWVAAANTIMWTEAKMYFNELDINECTLKTATCAPNVSSCTNTIGSYTCACLSGYTGNGYNCTGEFPLSTSSFRCFIFYPPLPQTLTNVLWKLTTVPPMPTVPTPLVPITVIAQQVLREMEWRAQIVLEGMIVRPPLRAPAFQGLIIVLVILGTQEMALFVQVSCAFLWHCPEN